MSVTKAEDNVTNEMSEVVKYTFTNTELAEERSVLSFIRTVAVFCGLYILLKKNIKNALFPKFIIILVNLLLAHRLYKLKYTAHKWYVRGLGGTLVVSAFCLLLLLK